VDQPDRRFAIVTSPGAGAPQALVLSDKLVVLLPQNQQSCADTLGAISVHVGHTGANKAMFLLA
jgi:hypothetical protein